jgi:hypothetical protein
VARVCHGLTDAGGARGVIGQLAQLTLDGGDLVIQIADGTVNRIAAFGMGFHGRVSGQCFAIINTMSQMVPATMSGAEAAAPMQA